MLFLGFVKEFQKISSYTTKCSMNHHHLVLDYLVDDVISTYKKLIWYRPTKWPNDKPRPHSLFLCTKPKWGASN
jgi:hypothetical protein